MKDYCSLMKDFPLQDLLAANSLESIKAGIGAIFLHMRKIRNTSYPPGRVMHLLEAVSRDVLAQMTKVCMFASVIQAPACHACTQLQLCLFGVLAGPGHSEAAACHI